MTNTAGLELLFATLLLFVLSLAVTVGLVLSFGWARLTGQPPGAIHRQLDLTLALIGMATVIAGGSIVVTSAGVAGVAERVIAGNPVMIGVLLGFGVTALVSGATIRWVVRA